MPRPGSEEACGDGALIQRMLLDDAPNVFLYTRSPTTASSPGEELHGAHQRYISATRDLARRQKADGQSGGATPLERIRSCRAMFFAAHVLLPHGPGHAARLLYHPAASWRHRDLMMSEQGYASDKVKLEQMLGRISPSTGSTPATSVRCCKAPRVSFWTKARPRRDPPEPALELRAGRPRMFFGL